MVTDEHEYRQARTTLGELCELIAAAEAGDAGDDGFRDVQLAGMRSHADDLRQEIANYETRILANARWGEIGERRDAAFIRRHASQLRNA